MKYKKAPKQKKELKKFAKGIKIFQKTKNYIKNPIKESINTGIDKALKMDTSRKSVGMQKNRAQFYNKRTKRFVKFNTKTKKIMGQRSKKGTPYKKIRIISNPKRTSTRSRRSNKA